MIKNLAYYCPRLQKIPPPAPSTSIQKEASYFNLLIVIIDTFTILSLTPRILSPQKIILSIMQDVEYTEEGLD